MAATESTIRVLVVGAKGRMGEAVVAAVAGAEGMDVVLAIDLGDDLDAAIDRARPDVAVDFTTPQAVEGNLRSLVAKDVRPVVGTTGLSAASLAEIQTLCSDKALGGLIAPNFAIGAVLMMEFARRAMSYMAGAEIIELHHPQKLDAPSGTSMRTRQRMLERSGNDREIPIHSVRLPGFLAHQEVILGNPGERLTIRHDSIDRNCFMPGVLLAIRRVVDLKELVVGLEELLEE